MAVDAQFVLTALGYGPDVPVAGYLTPMSEQSARRQAPDIAAVVNVIDVLGYPTCEREWDAVADRAGLFIVSVGQIAQVDRVLAAKAA